LTGVGAGAPVPARCLKRRNESLRQEPTAVAFRPAFLREFIEISFLDDVREDRGFNFPAQVRLEDLLAPQPVLKGQQGPCTIYTQCQCTWGTIRISCSGKVYCSAGLECDDHFYTCAMACNI
jgi:hypothetical protein